MAGEHACLQTDAATYQLSGKATPAGIANVHKLIDRARTEHPEVPPRDLSLFETALIEIANNVVEHGIPPGRVQWRWLLRIGGRALEGELIDTSEPVGIKIGKPMPAVSATSGRGLPIAEAALDYVLLSRIGSENHWLMLRWLGRC